MNMKSKKHRVLFIGQLEMWESRGREAIDALAAIRRPKGDEVYIPLDDEDAIFKHICKGQIVAIVVPDDAAKQKDSIAFHVKQGEQSEMACVSGTSAKEERGVICLAAGPHAAENFSRAKTLGELEEKLAEAEAEAPGLAAWHKTIEKVEEQK